MSGAWRLGVLRGAGPVPAPGTLVVKLGGSLLARPGWARLVRGLLAALPAPRLLVAGGGPLVDGLRVIDRAEPQAAELAHFLAIECMGHTARISSAALGAPLVAAPGPGDPETCILDVPAWLGRAGRDCHLPVGWHVTSDSIAAAVATAVGGGLMLAKSVEPPHDDLSRLADAGWLDGFFAEASHPLTWIGWSAPR